MFQTPQYREICLTDDDLKAPPVEKYEETRTRATAMGQMVTKKWREGKYIIITDEHEDLESIDGIPGYGQFTEKMHRSIPAIVDVAALVDTCCNTEWGKDSLAVYPWNEYGSFVHNLFPVPEEMNYDMANNVLQDPVFSRHDPRMIEIDDCSYHGTTREQRFQKYRKTGVTKQVAAEMLAQEDAAYIKTILRYYSGIEIATVSCRVHIPGWDMYESWGIPIELIGDATEDIAEAEADAAMDVAYQMEEAGWDIINKPVYPDAKLINAKRQYASNMEIGNWKEYKE